jgi:hypothetical protein
VSDPQALPTALPVPPPELAALGARLRAEWRADEEEWTQAAAQRWAHERRLSDVLREYAARGDRVTIETAGRAFRGTVVAVGDDRVDLDTGGVAVTVRTAFAPGPARMVAPIVVWRSGVARAGGLRLPAALVSFRARLLELEAAGVRVRVGLASNGTELCGRMQVGRDHVLVRSDAEAMLPAGWIAYVVSAEAAS